MRGNLGLRSMKAELIAIVVATLLLCTFSAFAGKTASCKVLTIEASTSGQGIDPALKAHAVVFQKKPFADYNTFKLVHSQSYDLAKGANAQIVLPSPIVGELSFNKITAGRLDLTLTLKRPSLPSVVINGKAAPGSPFFAAGLKSPHGRWVFGIICNHKTGTIDN